MNGERSFADRRRDPLEWVAAAMSAVLRERFSLFINQRQSELGADAHIAAVARRMRCGEPGAAIVDGKYLLSIEAHVEELAIATREKQSRGAGGEGGSHAAG